MLRRVRVSGSRAPSRSCGDLAPASTAPYVDTEAVVQEARSFACGRRPAVLADAWPTQRAAPLTVRIARGIAIGESAGRGAGDAWEDVDDRHRRGRRAHRGARAEPEAQEDDRRGAREPAAGFVAGAGDTPRQQRRRVRRGARPASSGRRLSSRRSSATPRARGGTSRAGRRLARDRSREGHPMADPRRGDHRSARSRPRRSRGARGRSPAVCAFTPRGTISTTRRASKRTKRRARCGSSRQTSTPTGWSSDRPSRALRASAGSQFGRHGPARLRVVEARATVVCSPFRVGQTMNLSVRPGGTCLAGSYRVERQIGEGGWARCSSPSKRSRASRRDFQGAARRHRAGGLGAWSRGFEREARAAAALQSPRRHAQPSTSARARAGRRSW